MYQCIDSLPLLDLKVNREMDVDLYNAGGYLYCAGGYPNLHILKTLLRIKYTHTNKYK